MVTRGQFGGDDLSKHNLIIIKARQGVYRARTTCQSTTTSNGSTEVILPERALFMKKRTSWDN